MNPRESHFRKAIAHIAKNKERVFTAADPEFACWLAERRVPAAIAQFLCANSINESLPLMDFGEVMTPTQVMEENTRDPNMLRAGFLQIARAPNGDMIVIDLIEGHGRVGFLSHEHLWEADSPEPREFFAPVAASIGDFFAGAAFNEEFPPDFFAAQEIERLYVADD